MESATPLMYHPQLMCYPLPTHRSVWRWLAAAKYLGLWAKSLVLFYLRTVLDLSKWFLLPEKLIRFSGICSTFIFPPFLPRFVNVLSHQKCFSACLHWIGFTGGKVEVLWCGNMYLWFWSQNMSTEAHIISLKFLQMFKFFGHGQKLNVQI